MRMPESIRLALLRWADRYSRKRAPDNPIGGDYLHRWYVTPWRRWGDPQSTSRIRRLIARLPNVYLHRFGRSDYDRALHDHPWPSVSLILEGGYYEHVPEQPEIEHSPERRVWRPAGSVTARRATARHRIELPPSSGCVTTVFVTGFRRRQWGFWCREGWRSYPEFEQRGGCD